MTTWSIRFRPIAFAAATMRCASRSSLPGKPVSNRSDCPLGAAKSVEAPPATSIQEICKRPPPGCASDEQTRASTPTNVAASARVMCVSPSSRLKSRVTKEPTTTGEYLSPVRSAMLRVKRITRAASHKVHEPPGSAEPCRRVHQPQPERIGRNQHDDTGNECLIHMIVSSDIQSET